MVALSIYIIRRKAKTKSFKISCPNFCRCGGVHFSPVLSFILWSFCDKTDEPHNL